MASPELPYQNMKRSCKRFRFQSLLPRVKSICTWTCPSHYYSFTWGEKTEISRSFKPTHWKRTWCWERRMGWQRMRWRDKIIKWMDMNLSKLWEIVEDQGAWCAEIHGVTKSQTWLKTEQQQPTSDLIPCQLQPDLKKDNKNANIQNCSITISRIYSKTSLDMQRNRKRWTINGKCQVIGTQKFQR